MLWKTLTVTVVTFQSKMVFNGDGWYCKCYGIVNVMENPDCYCCDISEQDGIQWRWLVLYATLVLVLLLRQEK